MREHTKINWALDVEIGNAKSLEMDLGKGPLKLLLSRCNTSSFDDEDTLPISRVPLKRLSLK